MQSAQRLVDLARVEDWLLAGWMAVASPLLMRVQGSAGPFDSGRLLDGTLDLLAVTGALACLVTTSSDRAAGDDPDVLERASVGPLVGGLLLVAISAMDGLNLPSTAAWIVVALASVAIVVVRIRWPHLPTQIRRGLVAPFTLIAGGLFATLTNQITAGSPFDRDLGGVDLGTLGLALGFFVLFAAVFYAMLIYAPRQVAEREGGPLSWIVRFGFFIAGTAFGLGWLGFIGG